MWHTINYIWINYFWASLKGNGPEALVQTVAYGAIAVAFWPAVRKIIRQEAELARGEFHKVEAELKAEEKKVVGFVKAIVRSPAKAVKALSRVRVTVKDVQAVDAVGSVVDKVDPTLAPEVKAVEGAAKAVETSAAPTSSSTIMGSK